MLRKTLLTVCALVCLYTPALFAQSGHYSDTSFKFTGFTVLPAAGAKITICSSGATGVPCTPKATIYSDAALMNPISNPITLPASGRWEFWATQGQYSYTITGPGINAQGPYTLITVSPSGGGGGGTGVPFRGPNYLSDITNSFNGGAVCNGSADNTTAFTNTLTAITYPTGNGGTVFLPHNCTIAPGTLPWNQYVRNTIGLGGQLNLGATLGLAAGTSMKCMVPGQFSPTSVTSFGGDKTCQIIPAGGASFSPLIDLTFQGGASNPFNLTDLTIYTNGTHPGSQTLLHTQFNTLGHQIVNVNAVAQQAGDLACDFEGFYTTIIGGSCSSAGGENVLPAMRWNNSSGTNGGLFMERTFIGNQGMLFTWKTPSGGTQSGAFTFRNMLQENCTAPFSTFNTWGGTTYGMLYDNVAQADCSGPSMVEIKSDQSYCTGCTVNGTVGGFVMLNPQPITSLFHSPAQLNGPDYYQLGPQGAFIVNLFPNKPLGIYGQWGFQKFDANGAVFQAPNTNSGSQQPALVSGGVATGLPNPENMNCAGSSSGGTIPAGTYYLQAAHVGTKFDGTAEIGFLSGEIYVVLTGTTSSIGCTWTTQPGATGTRVYMGTSDGLGENQYFSVSGSTATITITSATGTSGTPDTLNPGNQYIALNSYDNPYGNSFFGIAGLVGIGTRTPSYKLDVLGTARATSGLISPVMTFPEGAAPSALSGNTVCYADSTSHTLNCSQNGSGFANMLFANCSVSQSCTGVSSFTAHGVVLGQGTSALTATTAGTAGQCLISNGASSDPTYQSCGGTASTALSGLTAATGTNTIGNGNFAQRWNFSLSTNSTTAFYFGESGASTATGSQLLRASTLSASTLNPFQADNNGNGVVMSATGLLGPLGTGGYDYAGLKNFPAGCTNQFVRAVGLSLTCGSLLNADANFAAGGGLPQAQGGTGTTNAPVKPMLLLYAGCNNSGGAGTAAPAWGIPASGGMTAICKVDSTNGTVQGVLSAAHSNVAYATIQLPNDFSSFNQAKLQFTTSDTTNGHTIAWTISTACTNPNGTVADTPAYNTANTFTTTTIGGGAVANALYSTTAGTITATGCAANYVLHVKLARSGSDTSTDTAVSLTGALLLRYNGSYQ